MKDTSIKAVIRRAYWARRDYGNMEHDEYIRHDVAAVITKRIEEMKALELDRESPFYTEREFEIGMCEEAIRSWQYACALPLAAPVPLPPPPTWPVDSPIPHFGDPTAPPTFRMYTRPGSPILKCYDGGKKS